MILNWVPLPGHHLKGGFMLRKIGIVIILSLFLLYPGTLWGEDKDIPDVSAITVQPSIIISWNLLIPVFYLSDFYDYGTGSSLDFCFENVFSRNLLLTISSSAYTFNVLRQDEESLFSLLLSLDLGYMFEFTDIYQIAPILGFGYILHILTTSATRNYFFNPVILLKIYFYYQFSETLHLFLAPEYTIFFENNNMGQFIDIDVGIKFPLY